MHAPGPAALSVPAAPSRRGQAGVFAFLVLIWGSTWLVIKIGLEHYPPFFSLAVRFLIAGPVFLLLMRIRRERIPWARRYQPFFLTIALLSFVISFGVVYWSEQYITSGLTAVLFALFPLFTNLAAHVVLENEKVGRRRIAGLVTALAGIVIINSADLGQLHPLAPVAAGVVLLAPLAAAVSSVLSKKRLPEFSALAMAGIPMTYAGVIHVALWWLFERDVPLAWSGEGIAAIAYLTFVGSILTFTGYYWLLRHMEVGRLNLLAYLTPLVALGLGFFAAGETLTPRMLAGAALVLAGVALANRSPHRRGPGSAGARA